MSDFFKYMSGYDSNYLVNPCSESLAHLNLMHLQALITVPIGQALKGQGFY